MDRDYPLNHILDNIPSPCFVIDESAIKNNLTILEDIQTRTGCKILLALKAFALADMFPVMRNTLKGVCASSPHEARLGREEFGGMVHTFSAAYSGPDFRDIIKFSDYITFNSFSMWRRFKHIIEQEKKEIKCGIRVNPEHSEVMTAIYDPCAPKSRLGMRRSQFDGESLKGITGFHLHTLCEQNADALERTLKVFETGFKDLLNNITWLNLGGGHHITRDDYDIDLLCHIINRLKRQYNVEIYLEPGEAVVLNAGVLIGTVLDIVYNDINIAILDVSAATHMPDVLEMPYRPDVQGSGLAGEKAYTCRLAGPSCLAGDIIGDYSFDEELKVGSKVIFLDMAHYTMVKTNTFNGINLPSIACYNPLDNGFKIIRSFGYQDFKSRLS